MAIYLDPVTRLSSGILHYFFAPWAPIILQLQAQRVHTFSQGSLKSLGAVSKKAAGQIYHTEGLVRGRASLSLPGSMDLFDPIWRAAPLRVEVAAYKVFIGNLNYEL